MNTEEILNAALPRPITGEETVWLLNEAERNREVRACSWPCGITKETIQ